MTRNLLVLVLLSILTINGMGQTLLVEPKTATYAKAKALIIEEINFQDMNLGEAVDFFVRESEARDPQKKGLNFILKKPADPAVKEPVLNLNLKKVPLSDVLRYVASMTNYQVKYEESAIVLIPPDPVKKP